MTRSEHPGIWKIVYHQLRVRGADVFIPWDSFEGMVGKSRMASRSALTRARVELETVDGLTINGQCAAGFWVRKHT